MKTFFGHPAGLAPLFFTEMWERFSYYGMRAILLLFMTAPMVTGGLGFGVAKAGMVYGLYTAMVYLMSVPGGWVADKLIGQRRSVLYGGLIIIAGHICLALPSQASFFSGLALVVTGTGLLKPNVSTIVGQLYDEKDPRRDAGFSIFYIAINIGALISPLIIGWVAQKISWHWGFALAAIGMTLGVIQFATLGRLLGTAGAPPPKNPAARRTFALGAVATAAVAAIVILFVPVTAEGLNDLLGIVLIVITAVIFVGLFLGKGWSPIERKRLGAVFVLFLASIVFWSAFEQAGSTLTLFADRSTASTFLGYAYPSSWFQSVNSVFLVLLAPVFAWAWIRMGRLEPSTTVKFALGILFVGLGFALLLPVANGTAVSPLWLIGTYLLHTIGELFLSPVGLSAMTRLAPARICGFIMGVWFLSISLGNYIGGRVASVYERFSLPLIFGLVFAFCAVFAVIVFAMKKPMQKLSEGVN